MTRAVDEPYFAYSAYSAMTPPGISVKCPRCGGLGTVTADRERTYFKCTRCGGRAEKGRTVLRYDVHNQCEACGRYYRVELTDPAKQHFRMLNVACPHCGRVMPGEVHATDTKVSYLGEIREAREPYFGLELWFAARFEGRPVWAVNREHLCYLIDYLGADLREKPNGARGMKTQADHLPTFMKTAKNREKLVKLLRELQRK